MIMLSVISSCSASAGTEYAAGERSDQPGLLDRLDERSRWNQPELGVLPADQTLGTADAEVLEVDDRLEVDDDLIGDESVANVAQHAQTPDRVLVLLGRIDLVVGL